MPFVPDEIVSAAKLNLGTVIMGAREDNSRTFTNTGYLDLDALTGGAGTIGAVAVTVTTGVAAIIALGARLANNTAGDLVALTYRVSGATTINASDTNCASYTSYTANAAGSQSKVLYEAGLTPGSNTFELQARVTGGTGTISRIHLVVMPVMP